MKDRFETMPRTLRIFLLGFGLAFPAAGSPLAAQTDEDAAAAVLNRFHEALAQGDSTTALSLLADDVVILERGGVEDKEHYRSGHLAGDMRFAQAVKRERGVLNVQVVGDVAWVWSTSTTRGRMGDREINSRGAELAVLVRQDDGWKIKAIHWSSRRGR